MGISSHNAEPRGSDLVTALALVILEDWPPDTRLDVMFAAIGISIATDLTLAEFATLAESDFPTLSKMICLG